MAFQNLLIENKGRMRYIIISRESKLNALNKATLAELHTAFEEAFKSKDVGGIILTGAGQKAFVAGADIAEFNGINSDAGREIARHGQATVFDMIENGNKPVIAAINGFALGGGLELAMACHIRIAAESAKMGLPEVSLGLIPGYGGTQRLPLLVGKGRALEMILTGNMITASEAHQSGLVNHVVSQEQLLDTAEKIMETIFSRAPLAVAAAIAAVNTSHSREKGFEKEIEEFGKCFDTQDMKEGAAAFLEKRRPVFRGG